MLLKDTFHKYIKEEITAIRPPNTKNMNKVESKTKISSSKKSRKHNRFDYWRESSMKKVFKLNQLKWKISSQQSECFLRNEDISHG